MKNLLRLCFVVLFSTQLHAVDFALLNSDKAISRIALGSCNRQDLPQTHWPLITQQKPDLWLWLGDNVYADTEEMTVMQAKYAVLKQHANYQSFREQTPILGIWDDHDYGVNDGNRLYSQRQQAKELFMDFMDIPSEHPMRSREGIYASYELGPDGQKIKLILLDTRYFQDPLVRNPKGSDKNYQADMNGTILGQVQWEWLREQLTSSDADLHIIASSLQVIAEDHKYEMWSNFPNERKRLFDLMVDLKVKNPIFLSGDRHLSEISAIDWKGKTLYDVTASGMTHSFRGNSEYNRHRKGHLVTTESFAMLDFDWQKRTIHIKHMDMNGELLQDYSIVMDS